MNALLALVRCSRTLTAGKTSHTRLVLASTVRPGSPTRFLRPRAVLYSSAYSTAASDKATYTARTPLQHLAARITAHADALAATADNSHLTNSVNHDAKPPSSFILQQHTALRDALAEALILATNAKDFIPDLAARNNQFACLRWLCHFRVPEALPLADPGNGHLQQQQITSDGVTGIFPVTSYSSVADKTGVPLHQLRSIARMAMLTGILSEPTPEYLAHSPLSAAMIREPALMEWARFVTSTSAPMVSAMVEATERWGGDRSMSKTAYAVAWQTDLPLFAHVASDARLQARYASYMRVMTQSQGMAVQHLLEGWREGWSALAERGGVLVDVGGSAGHVSMEIAKHFPGIKVVVQDRAEVVARAQREALSALEKQGIILDLAFQAHDFFSPQPQRRPPGFETQGQGDVYLLRQILHDWCDDEAFAILRHLTGALEVAGPGSRLIIMDTVLPEPGTVSLSEEALLRVRDLTMQQAHNAHERSRAEWEDLFQKVHPMLRVRNVVQPFKSLMAVIEVALEPK